MNRRELDATAPTSSSPAVINSLLPAPPGAASISAFYKPSIFTDTLAEMTSQDIEKASREGAIVLWTLGVIEEHGPHLPTGTDIYLPTARLRRVRTLLSEHGIPSVILPAYYWGVNHVTSSFPSSIEVRPEIMTELMVDVLKSLKKGGFKSVFCASGHNDALHNQTIYEGIKKGRESSQIDASFLVDSMVARRLKFKSTDPKVTIYSASHEGTPPRFLDVHAGSFETSMMMATEPGLVRTDVMRSLRSTDLGPEDLAEWRKGHEHARKKTPLGYFGDPASADAEVGVRIQEAESIMMTAAIIRHLDSKK